MTDNIIPIGSRSNSSVVDTYMSGFAKCLSCKHEWKFRAPVGTVWLDCPACSLQMGRLAGPVLPPEGVPLWTCACGNNTFFITPKETLCIVCGKSHVFT